MPRSTSTRALTVTTTTVAVALGLSACSAFDGDRQVSAAPSAAHSTAESLCDLGSCETATVDRVVDGDTLDVITDTGGTEPVRVRVLGIDTPETVHPDKVPECMGQQASQTVRELAAAGTRVTVVTDKWADRFDFYDRRLAHVVIGETNLGAEMLEKGLAVTTSFEHSLQDQYQQAQDAAEHNHLGLWGHC